MFLFAFIRVRKEQSVTRQRKTLQAGDARPVRVVRKVESYQVYKGTFKLFVFGI